MIRGLEEQIARVRAQGFDSAREFPCHGKQRHATSDVANLVAKKRNRRDRRGRDTPLEAYRCQWCGFWRTGRADRSLRLESRR